VFCFDMAGGKFTAHPSLMGQDIRTLKDKSGAAFGEQIFNSAKEGTISTVDYVFPRPGGTDPVPKQSFVTRVANQGCAVGYYKYPTIGDSGALSISGLHFVSASPRNDVLSFGPGNSSELRPLSQYAVRPTHSCAAVSRRASPSVRPPVNCRVSRIPRVRQ